MKNEDLQTHLLFDSKELPAGKDWELFHRILFYYHVCAPFISNLKITAPWQTGHTGTMSQRSFDLWGALNEDWLDTHTAHKPSVCGPKHASKMWSWFIEWQMLVLFNTHHALESSPPCWLFLHVRNLKSWGYSPGRGAPWTLTETPLYLHGNDWARGRKQITVTHM